MPWSTTSRHERGYGTAWDKLRVRILKRDNYLCQCDECKASGRVLPASEVDHKISKATWQRRHGTLIGCDADENLQAINHDCHKRKTTTETGKTLREAVSADGWGRSGDGGRSEIFHRHRPYRAHNSHF